MLQLKNNVVMDMQKWTQRFFIHGSIRFGRNAQQRETQKKTYEYKNIYWFWYEFLKRSDAYKQVCKSKGQKGSSYLKKLYQDFGDIHSSDFHTWWNTKDKQFGVFNRGAYLFAEQSDYNLEVINNKDELVIDKNILNIKVHLSMSKREIKKLFNQIISRYHAGKVGKRKTTHEYSTALYKVQGRVDKGQVIKSLKKYLLVYDRYEQNKRIKNVKDRQKVWEIGNDKEIVSKFYYITKEQLSQTIALDEEQKMRGVDTNSKKKYITMYVGKLYKRSKQIIKNVEQGIFIGGNIL